MTHAPERAARQSRHPEPPPAALGARLRAKSIGAFCAPASPLRRDRGRVARPLAGASGAGKPAPPPAICPALRRARPGRPPRGPGCFHGRRPRPLLPCGCGTRPPMSTTSRRPPGPASPLAEADPILPPARPPSARSMTSRPLAVKDCRARSPERRSRPRPPGARRTAGPATKAHQPHPRHEARRRGIRPLIRDRWARPARS